MPVTVYRFDAKTFAEGLETHQVGKESVKIYNLARTIADCFKFGNKIGLDVAIEALRLARRRKRVLRNSSKPNSTPFQQVLQQYAIERFLYRVAGGCAADQLPV